MVGWVEWVRREWQIGVRDRSDTPVPNIVKFVTVFHDLAHYSFEWVAMTWKVAFETMLFQTFLDSLERAVVSQP